MTYTHFLRNLTVGKYPCNTMSIGSTVLPSRLTIARRSNRTCPQPTLVFSSPIYSIPKRQTTYSRNDIRITMSSQTLVVFTAHPPMVSNPIATLYVTGFYHVRHFSQYRFHTNLASSGSGPTPPSRCPRRIPYGARFVEG